MKRKHEQSKVFVDHRENFAMQSKLAVLAEIFLKKTLVFCLLRGVTNIVTYLT